MSTLHGSLLLLAAAALATAAMAYAPSKALAQAGACGPTRILVEGGTPSPFVLPAAAGETLVVEPDAVLRVRVEEPPDDAKLRWKSGRLFGDVGSATRDVGTAPIEIDVGSFSSYVRGLFEIEGALLSGSRELCSVTFELRIEGYAGVTAIASAGATGAAGLVSVASVPAMANATATKANVNVRLRRRRREGWRRWLPVPAWRRTIFGFLHWRCHGHRRHDHHANRRPSTRCRWPALSGAPSSAAGSLSALATRWERSGPTCNRRRR